MSGIDDVADIYPMSPTQAGMVFETLADTRPGMYVIQAVATLRGAVDPVALTTGVQLLVDRHPVLRTVLVWQGVGKPLQVVRERVEAEVEVLDVTSGGEPAEDALASFLEADRVAPLDFERRPAFRARLVRLDEHRHALVLTFHHALLDGWSTELLLDELLEIYAATTSGRAPALPERRPFKDFIAWLANRSPERSREYWVQQLDGVESLASIPLRRTGPESTDIASHTTTVRQASPELGAALGRLARAHNLTLNTLIHGAWSVLLSRAARQRDIVFGVTTAGRPAELSGASEMVGMFLTTVPCRVQVEGTRPVVDWLRSLQQQNLARVEHEHTPLVDIQRWVAQPPHTPLFDAVLVFENVPRHRVLADVAIERVDYFDVSNYPFALIVDPVGEMTFKVVSDNDVYDPSVAERVLRHLDTLLQSLVENAEGTVDDLSMTDERDADALRRWNRTTADLGDDRLVPELIAAHATSRPEAVAIASEHESLTYAGLRDRASAIADELRRAGVGPGSFVGVLLPRSIDACVAVLGVLDSGGAYVPLDPTYPREQLQFMIDDAAIDVIVGSPTTIGAADGIDAHTAIDDRLTIGLRRSSSGPRPAVPERQVGAEHPAYMIYTSGSTGRPNGVPITHAQLRHSTLARNVHYRDAPRAFLLLSSLSFDSSVVGLFWTLTTGGTLVVPDAGDELDPGALGRLIESREVTHTLCIPSLHRMLLQHVDAAALRTLCVVIVAGEPCPVDVVERHRALLADAELHNEYGPTEASVWCTVHRCVGDATGAVVPIGRPIANTEIFLVDDRGEPVPTGIPGEILIGGCGVADGYHDRPELTAQRFVERTDLRERFGSTSDRFFRTGDVGVMRDDGVLEFVGRTDDQIKIRGHRIEPAGIEEAVLRVPGVERCAVGVIDGDGNARLIAYVEAADETSDVRGRILESLRRDVPQYAIPAAIVVADRLPVLPNGKIDRRALADLTPAGVAHEAAVAPRTEVESTLHAVWSELLPDAEFGVHDDFFAIGGHSIIAVSLIERIRKATGRTLRLTELLDATTIAEQAALVSGGRVNTDEPSSLVALTPSGAGPKLFLVPPVAGTPMTFQALVASLSSDNQVFAFAPAGIDDDGAPDSTVEQMAARYVCDLVREQPTGPYWVGGSCFGGHVAWEMARQLRDRGGEVKSVIIIDGLAPDNGPGWSVSRPERTPVYLLKRTIWHAFNGSLARRLRARLHIGRLGPNFATVRAAHIAAKTAYRATAADVDVLLIQSSELRDRSEVAERWRALCGGRVTQRVLSGHHVELMESPAVVAQLLDEYLVSREQSADQSRTRSIAKGRVEAAEPEFVDG